MTKNSTLKLMLPIFFSFFVMGFVDIVNVATSYVKQDFDLSDTWANILPSMVFLWFAVISLPTGVIMDRIGRKNTVLISAAITAVGMFLPMISYTFNVMLVAFALLGIGNTILQVSLNPLIASIVDDKRSAGMLSMGQFVKAICSFTGPIIIAAVFGWFGDWKLIFPIYGALSVLSFIWILFAPIKEQVKDSTSRDSIGSIFAVLKDRRILLYFSAIVLLVGFEVGTMTATPKYILEICGLPIEQGSIFCSIYYAARTIGTLLGAYILTKVSIRSFFRATMILALLAMIVFMSQTEASSLKVTIFVLGLAVSNVFSVIFAFALQHNPQKANQASALMITGVAGGALIPPIMGVVADNSTQAISLIIPLLCLGYIFIVSLVISKK